ncbi:MAG: hypothetical protein K0U40_06310 [Betaproteobacteria bacterium]|nr:hypothetical protein [Betaproteobacteria bacterium]
MSKLINKNPGISSSRVVVRPHIPWYLRLFVIVIAGLLLLILSWGMYEAGSRSIIPKDEIAQEKLDQLFDSGTCLPEDRKELCIQLAGLIRQLQIKQTTSEDLTKKVKILGTENNHLKEELAFFQHLMSGNAKIDHDVSIYRFILKPESTTGLYRYSISLAQGGQRPTDFSGTLKFSINLNKNNKNLSVPLTNKETKDQDFPVNFKFFHKIEENFKLPPDTIVESLQVQVFEKDADTPILTQSIKPSL